ncbi:succinylglutamate desuccinylase/aspartoacylase family protein [Pararobbsia silviterrae]|uniref:Succinylglutamate desuccinylase/aspartoacylase family protein n=1 Tax=Pararobbsia silviterrae TaxID=1792498 RepID=A0A494X8Q1_9BURK|nr:succinylglutamate desuccinylase/aspartoacylase family protein [Pararobbsia silviterrae]RKP46622.1 succinylglutamate desuccinylase/aspartoacylase family protein [Pararobbsia silviterrae]
MEIRRTPLVSPSLGTARDLLQYHFGPAHAPRRIVIQSSVHADETPGMLVAWVLKRRLAELERDGLLRSHIVVVPVANPVGLNQRVSGSLIGRFDTDSGQNFNRQFLDIASLAGDRLEGQLGRDEARNGMLVRKAIVEALGERAPRTELESLQLALLRLAAPADIVLDLHCSLEGVLHLYTHARAWPAFEPLARYLGVGTSLLCDDSGGHSFDEALNLGWSRLIERFGDHPIPAAPLAVCVELRGLHDVTHALAERDADAILQFIALRGGIAGGVTPPPDLIREPVPLTGSEQIDAPCAGVLVYRAALGASVKPGEPIADIVDPLSDAVTTLVASIEGVLFTRRVVRYVHAGAMVAQIAGATPFRTGPLLSP